MSSNSKWGLKPVPTDRTWIGNQDGNNNASNPDNWNPTGVPQPGDALSMPSGTMNVRGNDLAGDTLSVNAPALPLQTIDINTSAAARLHLHLSSSSSPTATVNVNVQGTVMLTADVPGFNGFPRLNVSGGTIHFVGSSTFTAAQVFDDNLIGSAALNLTAPGGTHSTEYMEIKGAVGGGLTFNISANGPPNVSLLIDNPSQFHGLIDIHTAPPPTPSGWGYVAFMGLHVTSWDIRNDMLQMFNGNKLVDSTRVVGGSNSELQQNSLGCVSCLGFRRSTSRWPFDSDSPPYFVTGHTGRSRAAPQTTTFMFS